MYLTHIKQLTNYFTVETLSHFKPMLYYCLPESNWLHVFTLAGHIRGDKTLNCVCQSVTSGSVISWSRHPFNQSDGLIVWFCWTSAPPTMLILHDVKGYNAISGLGLRCERVVMHSLASAKDERGSMLVYCIKKKFILRSVWEMRLTYKTEL